MLHFICLKAAYSLLNIPAWSSCCYHRSTCHFISLFFWAVKMFGILAFAESDHRLDSWFSSCHSGFYVLCVYVCVCFCTCWYMCVFCSCTSAPFSLPCCWLPVKLQLPPSFSFLSVASLAPHLSPSFLFFNPPSPLILKPVWMSSGLLCKRHGRGKALCLGATHAASHRCLALLSICRWYLSRLSLAG